jgi:dihydrofolate reductase
MEATMAQKPRFSLVVVASSDGFIARAAGHAPADWQSPEEQAFFLGTVAAADWSVLGRTTHETAFRPDRRRIVFSHSAPMPEWRSPTHLWLDPQTTSPDEMAALVAPVRPMASALILGGADVAAWFLDRGRIDEVLLSIEPVSFRSGLPIFPSGGAGDPIELVRARGFEMRAERALNSRGTRLVVLTPLLNPNTGH